MKRELIGARLRVSYSRTFCSWNYSYGLCLQYLWLLGFRPI